MEALRLRTSTAVERLVARYGDRAHRLAIRITGNEQDAEEVAQDALWAVVRKIDTFRGHSAFGSWLYRIVANAAYEKLRMRRGRRADYSWDEGRPYVEARRAAAEWPAYESDPCRQMEWRMVLTAALNDLPADYRTVLVLRDVEGWSSAEIGQVLELSVPAVKSLVRRARALIRKQLQS